MKFRANTGEDGPNDSTSKRKAKTVENGSPPLENTSLDREDKVGESRTKRRKQEGTTGKDVDISECNDTKEEGENEELNGEESDTGDKKDHISDSKSDDTTDFSLLTGRDEDQREKEESPVTTDKNNNKTDTKDLEVEKNEEPSTETSVENSEVTDGEKTEKKNTNHTKTGLTISGRGGTKYLDESTEGCKHESLKGAPSSSSPGINATTGDVASDIKKDGNANPYDSLKYIMVRNDGKPESLIKLVALKSLFSRQLPKMPRPYIARLVFDRRHISLVILNDDPATKDTDEEVIGSICYRAFPDMRFAEIAFCAVNASHQVKGYGTKLMNLVKKEGARTGIEYFITYADNYAIGYFKKQGFTKTISMPKGRYQGLIKEYDGGTMMECYVHPSIDFTRIPEMLAAQREFILSRIRFKAQSHKVVYDPLPKNWMPNLDGVSRANEAAARALAVPGMIEAGWTMAEMMASTGQGKDLDRAKNALKSELITIVRKAEEQQFSWPFREPVDTNEVKDYLEIIKEPIDLLTIDKRIRKGDHYKSKKMLYADLMLMVNNCKLYNDETSTYVHCAVNLERFLKTLFASTK
mmetsp:Transcript_12400/g.26117  ORF Transcript_12400/g.26117 Transcript_12400/m.26117 type:complete len:582 (+) Transcript_12400:554-2299(+)|eukprot:CAMPEP_0168247494 /NCGR_PEP_ID=MMETSP0141_2-20121125/937_1 /TAXON_ID=44445 /ORGANISM="Pseudo-nitzschia australis, Strain 10249 10 AB" /LENGTH=581 /DNA_ID=CAMNT_0008183303 /DNA_START=12 /DNA_END=1757 /DNA_ORIENTATION=+